MDAVPAASASPPVPSAPGAPAASAAGRAVTAGPLPARERSLVPDLARGLALLGIALANSPSHISGREVGPGGKPVDGSTADRVVDVLVGVFVDNRAFPMFTLLLAYGLVVIARRQEAAGAPWPTARAVLLRRCAWLAAFGAAHLLLLFEGDILLPYGVLGLVLVLLVLRARDRVLVVAGSASLLVYAAFATLDGVAGALPDAEDQGPGAALLSETTVLGAFLQRVVGLASYLVLSPVVVLSFLAPAAIGILLARRRVLERPGEHLPLLRRIVLLGFPVSVLGSLPLVLASAGAWDAGVPGAVLAAGLHGLTGLAGAVAFVALVGWVVAARSARGLDAPPRAAVRAVAAVGERSLTCYLLQSVVMVPLLAPWALGLGAGAGTARVAAVAVATYLLTLAVAVLLARAGRPGPAEQLLRRLTYGPAASRADPPADQQPGQPAERQGRVRSAAT
ncbi:DUF418 domain-containing protein [Quadrisphaera sp. DSM 44207]|uniref:DUF418 domain-containing protein n=1 Tax=Quadrisphaera sp. DSM 44207 TaxID=1881057 RepID=UPI00088C5011|nr:DUF418 domain-containing protein [Quadrisphaera sp. DSM 44207]SDQ11597.1 Uncharacterized membrane protein YeiB [Quadrisphaera sp. DSM 44207]